MIGNPFTIERPQSWRSGGLSSFQPKGPTEMIVKPISEYTEKRNGKGLMGRPRTNGQRTPEGRLSRAIRAEQARHAVYIIFFPSAEVLKVGMTQRIEVRLESYKAKFPGETVVLCASFCVASRDDARILEAQFIRGMAAKGFERRKNEWFKVPLANVFEIVAESPSWALGVDIVSQSVLSEEDD